MSLEARIEAVLFAAGEPVSLDDLRRALGDDEPAGDDEIVEALARVRAYHNSRNGGFWVVEVAGGYEFRTRPRYAADVLRLRERRPPSLSPAAMECLAIVAYRQPCTRALVDRLRGVDSTAALKTLLERDLIRVAGKAREPGRPYLYRTTEHFLRAFGLVSLDHLPEPSDLAERQLSLDLARRNLIEGGPAGGEAAQLGPPDDEQEQTGADER
jgi:segregation and condensation protein B